MVEVCISTDKLRHSHVLVNQLARIGLAAVSIRRRIRGVACCCYSNSICLAIVELLVSLQGATYDGVGCLTRYRSRTK